MSGYVRRKSGGAALNDLGDHHQPIGYGLTAEDLKQNIGAGDAELRHLVVQNGHLGGTQLRVDGVVNTDDRHVLGNAKAKILQGPHSGASWSVEKMMESISWG